MPASRGKRRIYTDEDRARVLALALANPQMSSRKIGAITDVGRNKVNEWLAAAGDAQPDRVVRQTARVAAAASLSTGQSKSRGVGAEPGVSLFDTLLVDVTAAGSGTRADDYADKVLTGALPAGELVKLMARRHVNDRKRSDLVWNGGSAARACGFIEQHLKLVKSRWTGQPFGLFPWQAFLVESMFGWERADDGERRFTHLLMVHPKTSAKTPLATAMLAYRIFMEGAVNVHGYVVASNHSQAGIAMETLRDQLASIDGARPDGRGRNLRLMGGEDPSKCLDPVKRCLVRRMPNPAKGVGASGYTITALFVDELHEIQDTAAVEKLLFGLKAELNPLVIIGSNTGVTRSSAIGQWWDKGKATLENPGEGGDHLLPMLACADRGADYDDPAVWRAANPSMAYGLPGEAALRRDLLGNKGSPSLYATALRLNLGIWPDETESAWLSRYAVEKVLVDDIGDTSGLKSVVAIDLSSRRDLTAVAVVWLGEPLLARVTAWTPEANIRPWTAEYSTPWDEWAVAGHVRAVPSPAVDYDLVVREMRSVFDDPGCRMIAFDPWKKTEFVQAMDRAGAAWAPGEKVLPRRILSGMGPPHIVDHKQGYMRSKGDHQVQLWMHNSIEETSIAVLEGRIRIETNPVLVHGVASVAIARDASGNQRFIKNKTISGGRDDCAVALAMAVGAARALTGDARPQLSFEEMLGMRSA